MIYPYFSYNYRWLVIADAAVPDLNTWHSRGGLGGGQQET